jgi:hypothetical protein
VLTGGADQSDAPDRRNEQIELLSYSRVAAPDSASGGTLIPAKVKHYGYREGYEAALAAKYDFAARFYLDRLIELYTATDKPDEVKKWRAERAKYPPEVAPPSHSPYRKRIDSCPRFPLFCLPSDPLGGGLSLSVPIRTPEVMRPAVADLALDRDASLPVR